MARGATLESVMRELQKKAEEARKEGFTLGSRLALGHMHGLSIVSGTLGLVTERGLALEDAKKKLEAELERRSRNAWDVLDQGTVNGLEDGLEAIRSLEERK